MFANSNLYDIIKLTFSISHTEEIKISQTISLVLSIIGAITGIAGMVFGIFGILHNRFLAVHDYLSGIDDPDFISARSAVYNGGGGDSLDNEDLAAVINFFHHWGMLARKGYLPLWVFDSGCGAGVVRLYERSKSHIMKIRAEHSDQTYASDFEWLYHTLQKRNRK